MGENEKLSRRDFLKFGGLATLSVPLMRTIGKIDADTLLESKETYGGFLVRQLGEKEDPFEITDDFERIHAKDVVFSRVLYDEPLMERVEAVEKVFAPNQPGYSRLDVALAGASVFVGTYDNTNSPMQGPHDGLLSVNPLALSKDSITFEGKWQHNHTPEEVSEVIKKAAKFLGASLVGIAPFDERFLYTGYYDAFGGKGAKPIEVTEVVIPELPEGQVSAEEAGQLIKDTLSKWEGEDIKAFMIGMLENTPADQIPPEAPPIALAKMLPAGQFKENLAMFTAMPPSLLKIMAQRLKMDIEIADIDLGESAKPRYLENDTFAVPETMKHVIVLAFEMDQDSMEAAPTVMGDIAAMDGYSKMAITAGALGQFIRRLGYNAIPCGNNTAVSVPQAIQAGLGEGGRNGILITPKYGPRVRLAKVITDLPMANDKPIRFGVEEFCNVCKKCAEVCPSQAIPYGEKSFEASTVSSTSGIKKWSVNAEKCYFGWTANGSACSNCIRSCPFNKPEGWLHEATRILIGAKSGSIDKILVKLDDASGFGLEPKFKFWKSDNFIHIKS